MGTSSMFSFPFSFETLVTSFLLLIFVVPLLLHLLWYFIFHLGRTIPCSPVPPTVQVRHFFFHLFILSACAVWFLFYIFFFSNFFCLILQPHLTSVSSLFLGGILSSSLSSI